ncbi:PAP/25A associated domain family [Talaromyces stipitatus ATCC 10500]|uniref:polynucleotide adenylyltransferase n=1 Tax=Talaromyces stipitatus (strain ATCC 10500 / CBS 375.48 / QM 6759 / NRRL 1006) TaxID=441959 RepID=B8MQ17_TALSN|nr:PAP/25A associated domain family [Talaromyces stipitatus ATCC 10500]EED12907.1 PAP/25A associated domain family [Talaromyces stipitatus ATCC 10500]
MAWQSTIETTLPSRPPLIPQQSSSLPSTPYQRSRGLSLHSRSPSPRRRSTSPRSTHSETNSSSTFRKPLGGCKYETAMAYFRRRMPYSIGGDLLPEEKIGLKESLDQEEEKKLSAEMQVLYEQLLPSAESDDRRRQLVQKLEKLFNEQWPGNNIDVHVFGSSGNKLCSSDSDVDICITTSFKQLENVCLLAEVLAQHGMERVVCVSHARVPIVKIWDPQLKMACDMNVNNTLALENTRMIRTYVDIDERVRPLAMIIKHWTKRRVLNDAALGGTLSSYTWICLIINFLQTRDPPILPSLQQQAHKAHKVIDGVQVSFDDDLESLRGYGHSNRQTLGELLFQFFRYYGHEVDYEKYVVSVREGKLISKEEKGWHLLQNNRLCVEEPFNTSRNLGNTADDTSFRGLHTELRRAFQAISTADLEKCCEQFVFPPEEERIFERPAPQPRPILAPVLPTPPSGRGGRGGGRGARHSNHYGRGGNNSSRRSSSATNRGTNGNGYRTNNIPLSPDLNNLHAQQAQYLLHDQLYQQIQILQAQEQELRMHLQHQSIVTGRPPPVLIRQPLIQFSFPQQEMGTDDSSRARAGTVSHPPMTSFRPGMFYAPAYMHVAPPTVQGSNTNPPSPSLANAVPDLRRNPRRSSVANGSPSGSLRSHSQPARSMHSPAMQGLTPLYSSIPTDATRSSRDGMTPSSPGRTETDSSLNSLSASTVPTPTFFDEQHRHLEYGNYYLVPHNYPPAYMTMSLPATAYLQTADYRTTMPAYSEPFSPADDNSSTPTAHPVSPRGYSVPTQTQPQRDNSGPLIIDGSVPPQESRTSSRDDYSDQYVNSSVSGTSDTAGSWEVPSSRPDVFSNGVQDHTFEMDPFSMAREQESRSQMTNDAESNLTRQLQGLHLASTNAPTNNAEPARSFAERKNGKTGYVNGEYSPSRHSHQQRHQGKSNDKSSTMGNHTSNKETLSSSPTHRSRPNGVDSDKPNGVNHHNIHNHNHKPKLKASQDAHAGPALSPLNRKDAQPASLPRKPDGLPPVSGGRDHNHSNGGWQTTKKKHKRNAKSVAETQNHAHLAEPLPVDESLRKGG